MFAPQPTQPTIMLNDITPTATVAVKDLAGARTFYEETLGLTPVMSNDDLASYRCGSGSLLVYTSEHAGTNRATSVTWSVDDVIGLAAKLRENGVRFEEYEIPGATHDAGVYTHGSWQGAWFKDPDENIHHVVSM